ncbi:MAG: hypothetical protein N3A54_01035 [Patescibacteria group bacterium]|nr:hypothetical protein [Patescibacteria group bacterium]
MEKTVEALRGDIESTREVYRTVLLKVNDVDAKYNQRMNEIDSVYREELERAIQSFYKKVVSLSSSNGNIEEKLLILGFGELK